jgi:hypothetical protein
MDGGDDVLGVDLGSGEDLGGGVVDVLGGDGGVVDVLGGNGGVVDVLGSDGGVVNVLGSNGVGDGGRSHDDSLTDGVDKAILVQVLGEALKGQRAVALGGRNSISEGGSQRADGDTLVDVSGGGREGAGKDGGQNLRLQMVTPGPALVTKYLQRTS